jgi:hypothetical protein
MMVILLCASDFIGICALIMIREWDSGIHSAQYQVQMKDKKSMVQKMVILELNGLIGKQSHAEEPLRAFQ